MTPSVILKPGREASVLRKHPWVFSGAIEQVVGDPAGGEILPVRDATGRFLAWGYFNRLSQITLRLLSWNGEERIDEGFWRGRLARAIDGRCSLFPTHHRDESVEGSASLSGKGPVEHRTNAYRLVNAESDGLPGLIVDRYDEFLVAQFLTLGMEVRKAQLVELLAELVPGTTGIHERSDVEVREKEGLPSVVGPLHGASLPPEVIVTENGLQFVVDLVAGHKTGFYLDQRENRAILEQYASGEVLNCFAYTGAFAVYAARGGAGRITNVETSASALVLARRNLALNGFAGRHDEHIEADVFHELRRYRDAGRQFDVVLLDPPKFAPSRRAGTHQSSHPVDVRSSGRRAGTRTSTGWRCGCSGREAACFLFPVPRPSAPICSKRSSLEQRSMRAVMSRSSAGWPRGPITPFCSPFPNRPI